MKTSVPVQNGWPEEKRRVHGPIAKYWSERGNISLHDGLLLPILVTVRSNNNT